MSSWYLITYDVRDSSRLRRVAHHLQGYGERLQYSVFRCKLSERSVERLRWELSKIMSPEDGLLVIGLCAPCAARVKRRGTGGAWGDDPPAHLVV